MPALDRCYPQVVRALEKAGWRVSPVPHAIRVPGRRNPLLADIRAVQNETEIIIVEVKCFMDDPLIELYTCIGQYLISGVCFASRPVRHRFIWPFQTLHIMVSLKIWAWRLSTKLP